MERVKACTYQKLLTINATCQTLGELGKVGNYVYIKVL